MLYRDIASMEWRIKYPKASITHLGAVRSDHNPLLLDTNPPNFLSRSFRFEVAWTRDPKSHEVVKNSWQIDSKGPDCYKLFRKQQATRTALKKWNKELFVHCRTRINILTDQIRDLEEGCY